MFDAAGGLDLTNPDIRRQVELAQAMARGGRGVPGFGPMMVRMDAQHMQLMRREGDFRPEDYERLLALDDGDTPTRRLRAASAMELSRLPVFRYSPPDAGRDKPTKPPSLPHGVPSTNGAGGGAVAGGGGPKSSPSSSSSPSASSKSKSQAKGEDESKGKCMVCLEHFETGEQLKMLPCLHYFHEDCADKWLVEKAVCPVCMNSIRGEEEQGADGDTRALEARGAAAPAGAAAAGAGAAASGAAPTAEGP